MERTPHTYHVLLKAAGPASSTWEQYEQHVARFVANRAQADPLGAGRRGPSLVSG